MNIIMMPCGFPQENDVLHPPKGMSVEEVTTLGVFRGELPNGMPVVVSCWKPTREELSEIQQTGRVWVLVLGETMAPIAPTGFCPFTEETHDQAEKDR